MLQWALLVLAILFVIVAYIVIQGTRAALAWRRAAAAGDAKVIGDLVEDALNTWRSMKRPKQVPVEVWRGIQSTQLVFVAAGFVRASCQADGEYRLVKDRWVEVRSPLQEAMAITARAADMLLYEVPHFQPERIQIDVYSSYRDADGNARHDCILTTAADRRVAQQLDWEQWPAEEIVSALGGRYRLDNRGRPLPVQPEEPASAEAPSGNSPQAAARR